MAAHQAPIPGILQARILEWAAISISSALKWKVKVKSLSHVWLFVTPWTAAYQAPPSMGFSRQEYWSGVPLPSPKLAEKSGFILNAFFSFNLIKLLKLLLFYSFIYDLFSVQCILWAGVQGMKRSYLAEMLAEVLMSQGVRVCGQTEI